MIIRGIIRFDTKQVMAAKRGALTQYRAPAHVYDADAQKGRRLTIWGRAQIGDLFRVVEPAVYYTAFNCRSDNVFPADFPRGMAHAPQWIAGRRHLKRHGTSGEKRALLVVDKRLERLNSITAADAEASGAEMHVRAGRPYYRMGDDNRCEGITPQEAFLAWWKRLYGEISLKANPEVAVIEFRLIEECAADYLGKANDGDLGALTAADEAIGERAA
ncbi:MAG TPA: hypothetical protein VKR31_10365 [Rhizomicrobium sp.]|nr:hypothetical protein [Rhizomicrobium sp.]